MNRIVVLEVALQASVDIGAVGDVEVCVGQERAAAGLQRMDGDAAGGEEFGRSKEAACLVPRADMQVFGALAGSGELAE
ncbi:hypothetical protein AB0D83_19115 [Streptomyces decoyicus]|uniref:hypothetical protein n=1 Tax=Streptomyces decoyicus TaxID=249567 RepID=UPI0033FC2C85